MSTATNKAIVRRYLEQVANEQRYDLIEEFLDENIELHGSHLSPGREAIKSWYTMLLTAIPDFQVTIDDTVAEGDRVVTRLTSGGTHKGQFQGIPPTGKMLKISGISIFRLQNGKIVEGWLVNDELGMMRQMGLIPVPETA